MNKLTRFFLIYGLKFMLWLSFLNGMKDLSVITVLTS